MSQVANAKIPNNTNIEFRMYQGRIYHKNLELQFPEFTLRTSGSVGLDETLAITAELPVPPKWIRDSRLGQALKGGPKIVLPIGGTLHKPKIDQKALDKAMADFLRKTADGLLKNELGRQIDRLIPGMQPKQP
jgi:hypothetical protein